ncbi:uncharacterized protein PV09_07241 [Verruconis gallopava]|uniref:Condensation domain-containing protein n=1 Tax=Verruconis gallopava TaxID=253628 RepID=A0A0D1YJZ8_9PEZI|nr:uncharacterized protein PV09_07241 [Verruconis gallopava]KIW01192.1 hypothetical protein PV09_07241 [Verruconis gallopava]
MISEFIRPTIPLIPGFTKLPPLDQVEGRFIVPPILVFRLDAPDARDAIIQDLRDGLAATIEEIPFIAADVVPDEVERGTIKLETGEDAGVWLHIHELPEIEFDNLERRHFAPLNFPVLELMPEPRKHDWQRSPVLTIQATFITGGLLLVFNSHHSVMDGRGMSVFGKTWAKHVGAVSEGRHAPRALAQIDRIQAFGFGSMRRCMQLSDFPSYRITKQEWRSALQRELLETALARDTSHPKFELLQQLHLSYWTISRKSLLAIKQAAVQSDASGPLLTDSAVISALLWRHITRARQLSRRGVRATCLLNVVNVCRRLNPPLPLDYPGNALAHAKTSATPTEVESEKPLYELARQVNDSIDWWTSERIWGLIGAIDATPHVGKVEPAMDNFQGPDLEITNSGSFGDLLHLEWSSDLGKAVCLRFPYVPIYDGWVNVLPSSDDSPVELLIALDKTTVARLREDKDWASFATEYE